MTTTDEVGRRRGRQHTRVIVLNVDRCQARCPDVVVAHLAPFGPGDRVRVSARCTEIELRSGKAGAGLTGIAGSGARLLPRRSVANVKTVRTWRSRAGRGSRDGGEASKRRSRLSEDKSAGGPLVTHRYSLSLLERSTGCMYLVAILGGEKTIGRNLSPTRVLPPCPPVGRTPPFHLPLCQASLRKRPSPTAGGGSPAATDPASERTEGRKRPTRASDGLVRPAPSSATARSRRTPTLGGARRGMGWQDLEVVRA